MFDSITKSFGGVIDKLRGKTYINEDDFNSALREIRIALLEADVSLPVVKDFIEQIRKKTIGEEVIKKVSPEQMIVKIINDELMRLLGGDSPEINFDKYKPFFIMMIGLQGVGKTTNSVKLAQQITTKHNKKVLLVSLDIYRPAAMKQLEILAKQANIDSLEIKESEKPLEIVKRTSEFIESKQIYDVVIFDTAGRLAIDTNLMEELDKLEKKIQPHEKILVADSLMGQDAVNVAKEFNEMIGITGIILTRIDGDGRAGSALSMKMITGVPIRYMSYGEKLSQFEIFFPERIASRILDMGDIISFVEKAQEVISQEEIEKTEKKIIEGNFDFDDFLSQLKNLKKLGGFGNMISFLPGAGKIKDFLQAKGFDDNFLKKQESIIHSMTKQEKQHPDILNSSRKFRIAKGSGTNIQDVNSLLKKFKEIKKTINTVGKMDKNELKSVMNQLGNIKESDINF
jgi:signal recognition particle subunit SRP54